MKRKAHTSISGNGSFGSAWNSSKIGSHDSNDNIKENAKAIYEFNSVGSSDIDPIIWSTGHYGPEFSTTIKKYAKATYEFNSVGSSDIDPIIWSTGHYGPEFSTTSKQDSEDLTKHLLDIKNKSNYDEFAYQTDNEQMSKDKGVFLFGVDKWLEERGFGNYVELFETHEVDEEALPLLTFEDLKEMGVDAVGPRRKLYNAICQLRGTIDNQGKIAQNLDQLLNY